MKEQCGAYAAPLYHVVCLLISQFWEQLYSSGFIEELIETAAITRCENKQCIVVCLFIMFDECTGEVAVSVARDLDAFACSAK
jgi:hypothetical protein